MKIFLILIGGALGAILRYGVGIFSAKYYGTSFPLGTLIVNLVGCLLIGLVFGLGEQRGVSPHFRLFFVTGFLGALTTFSTYSLETVNSASSGLISLALFNIAINNVGGLLLVVAGMSLARII